MSKTKSSVETTDSAKVTNAQLKDVTRKEIAEENFVIEVNELVLASDSSEYAGTLLCSPNKYNTSGNYRLYQGALDRLVKQTNCQSDRQLSELIAKGGSVLSMQIETRRRGQTYKDASGVVKEHGAKMKSGVDLFYRPNNMKINLSEESRDDLLFEIENESARVKAFQLALAQRLNRRKQVTAPAAVNAEAVEEIEGDYNPTM